MLLAACAHTARTPPGAGQGSASYRVAADTGLVHYKLALGQVAMGATLEQHAAPAYPASMLSTCPALVELPARVIVDTQGGVEEVRMTALPSRQPFADAVRRAVGSWSYTPLTITRWAADAEGTSHPVDSEARPFSLDYVFTFRCAQGHTSVSAGPRQAAR
jgi:hypothetical protein